MRVVFVMTRPQKQTVCPRLRPAPSPGLWFGRQLTRRLSREAFIRLVTWLVLASGLALIGRYLSL